MPRRRTAGFTLVEMITVLAIFGIGSALFYATFMNNWRVLDDQLVRVNLWQDANSIVGSVSGNGRGTRTMSVFEDSVSKTVNLELYDSSSIVYTMTSNGRLEMTKGGATVLLTDRVDFSHSSFESFQNSLKFTLTLQDESFGRIILVETSTQVFPRCATCF